MADNNPGQQKIKAAVMVGRMNPPTAGHYKVIDTMKAFTRKNKDYTSTPVVVVVDGKQTSKDLSKNPLSAEDRIKFMTASGKANGVIFLTAPSAFEAFTAVRNAGLEPIAVAAGSDRSDKYIKMLDKYFTTDDGEKIDHVAIPGLDRDAVEDTSEKTAMEQALEDLKKGNDIDVSEISGSMARRAAELGYEEEFSKIVGLDHKPKLSKLLFDKVKSSLEQGSE